MPLSEYHNTILEARKIPLKEVASIRQRLETAYRAAWVEIDAMLRDSSRSDGEFSRRIWESKRMDLERLLMELGVDIKNDLNTTVHQVATDTTQARQAATNVLLRERNLPIVVDFGRVPQETVEALAAIQDVEGFKFSAEVWGKTQADLINRHVLRGAAQTKSISDIAKDLRPFILGADALTPDELTDLRRIRGRQALKLGHSIKYKTERLVRTEIMQAAWEAGRRSADASPIVAGVKWNLSTRHPRYDVCDILASQDLYGLGKGVYPSATIPPRPHPNCFCFQADVLRPVEDWDKPKPTPELKTDTKKARIARPSGITDAFFERQKELAISLSQTGG